MSEYRPGLFEIFFYAGANTLPDPKQVTDFFKFDFILGFAVKQSDLQFIRIIEIQPGNRFTVVVGKQNCAISFSVPQNNIFNRSVFAGNRPDYVIGFKFIGGGYYAVIAGIYF